MNAAFLLPFVMPMQTVRTTLALMFAPVEVVLLEMENLAETLMNAALLLPFVMPMQTVRTTLALMFAPVEVVLLEMENLAEI